MTLGLHLFSFVCMIILKYQGKGFMKFNLDVNIEEVNELHTHGIIHYDEVKLSCYRATRDTSIQQGENQILLEHDQAVQLYNHLKSVFGE